MLVFNGSLLIADGEFKTIGELIRAAIDARDLTAAQKSAEKSRWRCAVVEEGFLKPAGTLYMLDAYKGVVNGVATQADWQATDFTQVPGGGEPLDADLSRHFDRKTPLDSLVLYNMTGSDVTVYVYVQRAN